MSKRNEYIEQAKAKLDVLDAEINRLEARANEAKGDLKLEIKGEIREMKRAKRDADDKLREVRSASEAAWKDIKSGAEVAWQSLSRSIDSAKARFE